MSDVTLYMTVKKDGAPYVTNKGLTYHGLDATVGAYLMSKMASITDAVSRASKSAVRGGPVFEITLWVDTDGTPSSQATFGNISWDEFHHIEHFLARVQAQMVDDSLAAHRKKHG